VARRQLDYLDAPVSEKRIAAEEEGVGPLAHERREGRVNFLTGAGIENLDLQPECASSWFHVSQRGLHIRNISRVDEHTAALWWPLYVAFL
jgi:hypothetical protein